MASGSWHPQNIWHTFILIIFYVGGFFLRYSVRFCFSSPNTKKKWTMTKTTWFCSRQTWRGLEIEIMLVHFFLRLSQVLTAQTQHDDSSFLCPPCWCPLTQIPSTLKYNNRFASNCTQMPSIPSSAIRFRYLHKLNALSLGQCDWALCKNLFELRLRIARQCICGAWVSRESHVA